MAGGKPGLTEASKKEKKKEDDNEKRWDGWRRVETLS